MIYLLHRTKLIYILSVTVKCCVLSADATLNGLLLGIRQYFEILNTVWKLHCNNKSCRDRLGVFFRYYFALHFLIYFVCTAFFLHK